jgi:choline dehydrogenase-like flavoprotein
MRKAPHNTSTASQATSQSRDRLFVEEKRSLLSPLLNPNGTTTNDAVPAKHHYQSIQSSSDTNVILPIQLESKGSMGQSLKGSRTTANIIALAMALLLVLLVGLIVAGHPRSSSLSFQEAGLFNDYIIVGAGPSGIITATKLARLFPYLNILLIEAGTESQTAVQTNLNKRNKDATTCDAVGRQPKLNEFDVPLLWSGVASSAQGYPPSRRTMTVNNMSSRRYPADDLAARDPFAPVQYERHHWPIARTLMGKTVGGSGLLNAMIYIRSLSTDWNTWNLTGWDYETHILPEYIQLEHYVATSKKPSFRGMGGPIVTASAQQGTMDAIAPLFVQSAVNSGLDSNVDTGFNDRDPASRNGVGYYEFNIRHGIRDSVANAFLGQPPDSDRALPSNLYIETGVTVTRVLLALQVEQVNDASLPPRAIGVEYVRTSGVTTKRKDRVGLFLLRDGDNVGEVILAAGAILTPQLLANSGIGDSQYSNEGTVATTAVKVDLPGVGKNLRDHPVVTMGFEIDAEIALMGGASSIYTIGSELDEYFWSSMELNKMELETNQSATIDPLVAELTMQLGAIGTPGFSAGGFLRSPFADEDDPSPDIQLTVFPRHIEPHVTRQTQQDTRDHLRLLRNKAMLVTVALLKPEAHFEVKPSQSPIPLVVFDDASEQIEEDGDDADDETLLRVLSYRLPEIDLPAGEEWYLTKLDAKRLAWGMEQVRRIQAMAPLANHTGPEIYPGAHVRGKNLLGYVRDKSLPNSHWAGSCRMGSAEGDTMAVVDERLRVHRVNGLRIVDASVLPAVPNGNIHSTVCVVASRAATLIAEDRRVHEQERFQGS